MKNPTRFLLPAVLLLSSPLGVALAQTPAASPSPAASPTPAGARIDFPQPSPLSVVKQRVGVTDVEVEYSRPAKKGRDIYGGLVPFDKVWRTGANQSTKITFSDPVTLEGKPVPAGKYALYTIPTTGEWTVILHKKLDLAGAYGYKPEEDQVRVTVRPQPLGGTTPAESFTIGFGDLKNDGGTLFLDWDNLRVPVRFTVPTNEKVLAALTKATAPGAPELSAGSMYQAAGFNLDNGRDLNQALTWITQAFEKNPKAWWMANRKAQIQAKLGDKPGAIATSEKAIEIMQADPNGDPADVETARKFIASLR